MRLFQKLLPLLSLVFLTIYALAQKDYPTSIIRNEHLEVKLYLPDAENGYYRATRFDWAGVIGSLKYRGHQYFDPWLDYHDPTVHEAISGPVEAFTPIGYDDAKPGDDFLTIGVGVLQKQNDDPYQFATTYKNLNPGKWKVKQRKNRTEFVHSLDRGEGYSYKYGKTVRLIKDRPEMVLEHQLKNTGSKALITTVYNHNFFVIDQEPTGPNMVTKFPYPVQGEGRGFGELISAVDNRLVFRRNLQKGETVYTAGLQGFGPTAKDYDIRIENWKSGAGVRITSDQPMLKLPYWACATTACPEPYIEINVAPGQTFTWSINYSFYVVPGLSNH